MAATPLAVYLTWRRQPDSTMIVQWITPAADTASTVTYRLASAPAGSTSLAVAGAAVALPQAPQWSVHSAELEGLTPATSYSFQLPGESHSYLFRTLATTLKEPLRFIVGGDIYHDDIAAVRQMNRCAAATSPAFGLVGGDIAYASPTRPDRPQDIPRWLTWINTWSEDMVTPEGYLIPLLPVLGNHDVSGYYGQTAEQAAVFHTLFTMPGRNGFAVLDCGDYLSLFFLDSGHTNRIGGLQRYWLQSALQRRTKRMHLIAFYHVPAYPSVRSFDNAYSAAIRQHWVPLFEAAGLAAAFEHHDHAYKRTFPLLAGRIDYRGVLYFGDGAWGTRKPRTPRKPSESWYIAASSAKRHFYLVTLETGQMHVVAYDEEGHPFDSCSRHRVFKPIYQHSSGKKGSP